MAPLFIPGREYRRSELHDQYGGNRQGGIAPSAKSPYIFIFSGKTGEQHGYKDRWENEHVYSYTGEGQIGDMQFTKGNLALQKHIADGKRVFLFIYSRKGYVIFESELEFVDFDFFIGQDTENNDRVAIKFFFKKAGSSLDYTVDDKSPLSQKVPDKKDLKISEKPNETERKGLVTSRIGQGAYRKSILHRWEYKCAVTEYASHQILIASHIVPWRNATDDERLDVANGILLSPNYDALFDRHLISFEDTGKILLSNTLLQSNYRTLGVTGKEVIKGFSADNHRYLERHRHMLIK